MLLTAQQKGYSGHELTLHCTAAMTPHYPGGVIPAREGFLLAMLRSPSPVASGVWLTEDPSLRHLPPTRGVRRPCNSRRRGHTRPPVCHLMDHAGLGGTGAAAQRHNKGSGGKQRKRPGRGHSLHPLTYTPQGPGLWSVAQLHPATELFLGLSTAPLLCSSPH